MSLEIQAADRDLLEKALKKLQFKYQRLNDDFTIHINGQQLYISKATARLPSQLQEQLNMIKRAYAGEVVEAAAEQFSWTVTEEGDELILRRYS